MAVTEALNNDELELISGISEEDFPDKESDEYIKELIKKVIRYEVDSYVRKDPENEDPIVISDEEIESYMDYYLATYKDVIHKPYLDMNSTSHHLEYTRSSLSKYNLMLYARRRFAEIDLGIEEDGRVETLADITDYRDVVDLNDIKKETQENSVAIKKNDGARLLVKFLTKMRYGGQNMNQVDLILEKLNFDIGRFEESTDSNKEKNIKDTKHAIGIISQIGFVKDGTTAKDGEWYKYFIDSLAYDKRAINLAKELNKSPVDSEKFVNKIFGPDMVLSLIQKFDPDVEKSEDFTFTVSGISLMMYHLASKIDSSMKSSNSKSLIYRGYIIHYMLDALDDSEEAAMHDLFADVLDRYKKNDKLYTMLKNNKFSKLFYEPVEIIG